MFVLCSVSVPACGGDMPAASSERACLLGGRERSLDAAGISPSVENEPFQTGGSLL